MCEKENISGLTQEAFGIFAFYGGLTPSEVAVKKGLEAGRDLSDCMGYTELAANLFRITQTKGKIAREGLKSHLELIMVYRQVGATIRNAIRDLVNSMPEDLPIGSCK